MKASGFSLCCLAGLLSFRLLAAPQSNYSAWLTEDVTYIITDDERAAFGLLHTDGEREQFIQNFWLRRDPTPNSIENEFREEHYRRIAYANEHFGSAIPGWKTDRGRIYIMFGPPDEIDAGGDSPQEVWRYRFIEGLGTNVALEFVDATNSGEFHLTTKTEKDHLPAVPCSGLTLLEQMGPLTKTQTYRGDCAAPVAAPKAKFADLAAGGKENSVILPLKAEVDFFPLTKASTMTYVTLQFSNQDLELQDTSATVEISGKVSTISGRTVEVFEEEMRSDAGPRQFQSPWAERISLAQKSFPLKPGTYRVSLACKDAVSGRVGTWEQVITVPGDQGGLAASNLVLADFVAPLPVRSSGGPFAIGGTKVRPRIGGSFQRDESLGAYLELYNGPTGGRAKYEVLVPGWSSPILSTTDDLTDLPGASRAQITLSKLLSLRELTPGSYSLRVTIYDAEGSVSFKKEAAFAVN